MDDDGIHQRRLMTRFSWLWLLGLLTGCNLATSPVPLFTDKDSVAAPHFRDGVWRLNDAECRVKESRPTEKWPKCADWAVVRQDHWMGYEQSEMHGWQWTRQSIILAAGSPPLVQFEDSTTKDGVASKIYYFLAFEPEESDQNGLMKRVSYWQVNCGVERAGPNRRPGAEAQIEHFAGLDDDCRPVSVDALRAAASASRPSPEKLLRMHWVRDGYH